MNNLVTKLSSIAALLGVLGAIGAGFVQYGKLTAKITELDKRKAVINQSVDLDPLHEKISSLEVDLIDQFLLLVFRTARTLHQWHLKHQGVQLLMII